MKKLLLINGPNLNMLGVREPGIYGSDSLKSIEEECALHAKSKGAELECFQSNHEGELIDKLHSAHGRYDGIVYNPGAHTHYSWALRDAVAAIDVPVVEVHISDVDGREDFRKISVFDGVVLKKIKGHGRRGYLEAIDVLCD